MLYTTETETNWLRANQTDKVCHCPHRECPVELLACCCRAVSSGVRGETSSQHGCHECQIAAGHRAGTVVGCWFIPHDSIWLHGYAGKWSHAGSTDRSPTTFILADDSRENSWSIGALVDLLEITHDMWQMPSINNIHHVLANRIKQSTHVVHKPNWTQRIIN